MTSQLAPAIRNRMILTIAACHGMTHMLEMILPTVRLEMHGAMAMSESTYGLLAGVYAMLFGIGALPVGVLADRIGSAKTLLVGMFGAGVVTILTALTLSLNWFTAGIIGLGIFTAFYHPTGLSWLSRTLKRPGKALGYHGVAGNIGTSVGPMLAGLIAGIGVAWAWRGVFVVYGLVALGTAYLVLDLIRRLARTEASETETVSEEKPSLSSFVTTITVPLALIYLNSMFFGMVYRGLLSYFPKLIETAMPSVAGNLGLIGTLTGVLYIFGIAGQLIGGNVAHYLRELTFVYPVIFGSLLVGVVVMWLTTGWTFFAVAVVMNVAMFLWQPVNNQLIADYADKASHGSAYGVSFTVQFTAGGIAPMLMGPVADGFGVKSVLGVLVAMGVVGVVTSMLVVRHRNDERRASEVIQRNA